MISSSPIEGKSDEENRRLENKNKVITFKFQPLILSNLPPQVANSQQNNLSTSGTPSSTKPNLPDEKKEEEIIEDDDNEAEALRAFLPTSFGVKKKSQDPTALHLHAKSNQAIQGINNFTDRIKKKETKEEKEIKVKKERGMVADDDELSDSNDSDDDEEYGPSRPPSASSDSDSTPIARLINQYSLPITHEATINSGNKLISTISIDTKGVRMLTGSLDSSIRLYEFNNMNSSLQPFRTFEPQEGFPLVDCAFSLDGSYILVGSGSASLKVCTRDGISVYETIKGDRYLHDQKFTKGHTGNVTSLLWHPHSLSTFLSTSADGTIRRWNMEDKKTEGKECCEVVKLRGVMRGTAVTSLAVNESGSLYAAAVTDGTIRLLKETSGKLIEQQSISSAHTKGSWTSHCLLAKDNIHLISRGGDHTVKLWDVRSTKSVLHCWENLLNSYEQTGLALSPSHQVIVACTSAATPTDTARLVFLSLTSPSTITTLPSLSPVGKSLIRPLWHPQLNQLFISSSSGSVHVLYDINESKKGILLCIGKKIKKVEHVGGVVETVGEIITPHSLPLFRAEPLNKKRHHEKMLKSDPAYTHTPLPPVGAHGSSGRIRENTNLTQFMLEKMVKKRKDPRELDPREALLAVDEKSKAEPIFFGTAYAKTQPFTIFAKEEEEEDKEDD